MTYTVSSGTLNPTQLNSTQHAVAGIELVHCDAVQGFTRYFYCCCYSTELLL